MSGSFHCYAAFAGSTGSSLASKRKIYSSGKRHKSGPRSRSPLLTPCSTRCRYAHKEPVEHALSAVLHLMDGRTLPAVRACPVYHPRVKAKASGPTHPMHHHLPGLDAGWCATSSSPRRGRGSESRQTADRHTGGRLTVSRRDDVGTASATPADWAATPPRLTVATAFYC